MINFSLWIIIIRRAYNYGIILRMRVYKISPSNEENYVEGMGQCGLTGIICPVCGQYGNSGPWYPTVDCSTVIDLGEDVAKHVKCLPPRGIWKPMNPDEYKNLATRLLPILRQDQPVLAGTSFGPMIGRAYGEIGDFAWANPWTPLVRESVFEEIKKAGFSVFGEPAQLKFRRDPRERLIQLEVRPTARLVASSFKQCSVCGACDVLTNRPTVDFASLDASTVIQSAREWTNVAFIGKIFADFIRDRKFTDAKLTPLKVE